MTKKNLKIAVGLAFLSSALVAHAQTSPIRPAYSYPATPPQGGPASIRVGESPVYFTPYLGVAAGYDDNLFLSSNNERSSALYVVSPGFKLDARSPNSVIYLSHQHQIGRYTNSRDDDYVDHATRLQADMAFSGRSFARLGVDYLKGHDPRGSTDRAIAGRPDEYKLWSPNATFAFGAPGAQGRAEAYYSYGQKRYTNNRATTTLSDRDTQEYGGALYVRVAPKTYVLGEIRKTTIDYKVRSPFSADETRYFAGVTWDATAATTGTLKVGRLKRDPDFGAPSFSTTNWEGTVTWSPRTYSVFNFYTTRSTNESTGLGNFIVSDVYGIDWNHSWNSVFMTGVALRFQRDDYQGFNRTDDTRSIGLKAGYKMRRWLTLGAEYTYSQRDSNLNLDYNKNLYFLTATITP